MTIKLYDEDSYIKEFDATVLSVSETEKGYKTELDRTAFFPEEGGQPPDKGTIDGVAVSYVEIKGDVIFHYLEKPLETGAKVHGVIDWDHRFRNMQMHSGEHVFSGLIYEKYGFNNVGFHLSDNSATMDYDGKLSKEEVLELEKLANEVIYKNVSIKAEYPEKEALDALEYRSKKELSGPIRIVTVEGVDVCACCAPHVKSTGEIGILKIQSVENYKGGIRINYLCGLRALEEYERKLDTLREISRVLSSKPGEEIAKINKLSEDLKQALFDLTALKYKNIKTDIERNFNEGQCAKGVYVLCKEDSSCIKYALSELLNLYSESAFVFAGDDESGYRYMAEAKSGDLSKVSSLYKEKYAAKGGGRPNSIQGTLFGNIEDIIKDSIE